MCGRAGIGGGFRGGMGREGTIDREVWWNERCLRGTLSTMSSEGVDGPEVDERLGTRFENDWCDIAFLTVRVVDNFEVMDSLSHSMFRATLWFMGSLLEWAPDANDRLDDDDPLDIVDSLSRRGLFFDGGAGSSLLGGAVGGATRDAEDWRTST